MAFISLSLICPGLAHSVFYLACKLVPFAPQRVFRATTSIQYANSGETCIVCHKAHVHCISIVVYSIIHAFSHVHRLALIAYQVHPLATGDVILLLRCPCSTCSTSLPSSSKTSMMDHRSSYSPNRLHGHQETYRLGRSQIHAPKK